jgi:uncharacterized protein (DUF1810 family)
VSNRTALGEALRESAIMTDRFNLQRFVDAQEPVYEQVCRELRAGRKQSHWIWYIFPQIAGLGMSPTSLRFAISSLKEASAYLAHPTLGPRLTECAGLVLDVEGRTAREIFGPVDEMKFRSSMTLFAKAAPNRDAFERCLEKYFAGAPDPATLARLQQGFDRP